MNNEPTWRFAPTGGGAETGNITGQTTFASDPIAKAVRELLQNSVDANEPGVSPVRVDFELINIPREQIGAGPLSRHLEQCRRELAAESDPAADEFIKALNVLKSPMIPALAVTDEGTTGLREEQWHNLIFREGSRSSRSRGATAHGGSYGIGKNAPFNLSLAKTVFYSTRYVSRPKQGRVTHLTGKSQLATHNDPDTPDDPRNRLQHIGFFACHEDGLNRPVTPPDIAPEFLLESTGAGVFVIGFDLEIPDWRHKIAAAAAENFFYAIHHGTLEVAVGSRVINRETLEQELDDAEYLKGNGSGNGNGRNHAKHYYQAIRDQEPMSTRPLGSLLDRIKGIRVWIAAGEKAPKRAAHLNKRGMIITDQGRVERNPFSPAGGSASWSPWCAVTMAEDEDTDGWIRQMEPPAHDAIQYDQIKAPDEQKQAKEELRHHRQQISQMIRDRIEAGYKAQGDNITELSHLFPDLPDLSPGVRSIEWKQTKPQEDQTRAVLDQSSGKKQPIDGGGQGKGDTGKGNSGDGQKDPPDFPADGSKRLLKSRIIRQDARTLNISFIMPLEVPATGVRVAVSAAGEQYDAAEQNLSLTQAEGPGVSLSGNAVRFQGIPGERVTARVTLAQPPEEYCAYNLIEATG